MVLEYINRYKNIAKTDMQKFKIPASITLAQGILESGAGSGPLSIQANNHFGIKCHKEWTGETVKYDDDAEQECFRKYNQPEESYNDHSQFLTSRKHYQSLFLLPINDYSAWAKGLKSAGYATDVEYPSKLIGLIERYNLSQYDDEVLGDKNPQISSPNPHVAISDATNHVVVKGDTLYSLSKKYSISIDDLKQKNNISETGISIGQNLIIK